MLAVIRLCALIGATISALLLSAPAGADPLPAGSYAKTCRAAEYQNGELRAQCKSRMRGYLAAKLAATDRCHGDIANIDGKLKCFPGPEGAPAGSYLQTCTGVQYADGLLTAKCLRKSGGYAPAELRISACDGDLSNDNGQLVCHAKYGVAVDAPR